MHGWWHYLGPVIKGPRVCVTTAMSSQPQQALFSSPPLSAIPASIYRGLHTILGFEIVRSQRGYHKLLFCMAAKCEETVAMSPSHASTNCEVRSVQKMQATRSARPGAAATKATDLARGLENLHQQAPESIHHAKCLAVFDWSCANTGATNWSPVRADFEG